MKSYFNAIKNLFKPRYSERVGANLYALCVEQSRQPIFYLEYGIADEIGSRFEFLSLHIIMIMSFLKSKSEQADEVSQGLLDAFMLGLDTTLREQGVGDISVAKKMKPLIKTIYSRLKSWDEFFQLNPKSQEMRDYLSQTLYAGNEGTKVENLTQKINVILDYLYEMRLGFKLDDLINGKIEWPKIMLSTAEVYKKDE